MKMVVHRIFICPYSITTVPCLELDELFVNTMTRGSVAHVTLPLCMCHVNRLKNLPSFHIFGSRFPRPVLKTSFHILLGMGVSVWNAWYIYRKGCRDVKHTTVA